ncbi:hypothetical protein L596_020682 [Steinernema carpocapsae]|uniref:Uncharacterized protein n=1 Tax=Steinernema carpocapsae TaxID=34508 RepID=A0A4U5MU97_STECR|nr:hypothetical protein L596_020682 [Steinernema carpocapsae]
MLIWATRSETESPTVDSPSEQVSDFNSDSSSLADILYLDTSTLNVSEPENIQNRFTCILSDQDPWHPDIIPFTDPNAKVSCLSSKKHELVTSLNNGKILLTAFGVKHDYKCDARCVWPKGDYNPRLDEFENIFTFKAICDVVETRCQSSTFGSAKHGMLHSQIVEKEDDMDYSTHKLTDPKPPPSSEDERPSVYVLILDSTGMAQFTRQMHRTHTQLTDFYDAIPFYYFNKVQYNSRPNGFAFFLGRQLHKLQKNPYSPEIPADVSVEESYNPLDGIGSFVGHKFRDAGYHTMGAEDWAPFGLARSGNLGFNRTPLKHYYVGFAERQETEPIKSTLDSLCIPLYNHAFNYLDQFLSAYKNESQFGYLWINSLAHDDSNGLYHADDLFYRFLRKHKSRTTAGIEEEFGLPAKANQKTSTLHLLSLFLRSSATVPCISS